MNIEYNQPLSKQSETVLKSLQRAVTAALERKRKLGQYAVLWDGNTTKKVYLDESTVEEIRPESR